MQVVSDDRCGVGVVRLVQEEVREAAVRLSLFQLADVLTQKVREVLVAEGDDVALDHHAGDEALAEGANAPGSHARHVAEAARREGLGQAYEPSHTLSRLVHARRLRDRCREETLEQVVRRRGSACSIASPTVAAAPTRSSKSTYNCTRGFPLLFE